MTDRQADLERVAREYIEKWKPGYADAAEITRLVTLLAAQRAADSQRIAELEAEVAKWKQEAQWAARILLLPMVFNSMNKESQDRAERILNGML